MDSLELDIALPRRGFDLRVALSLGAETVAIIGPSGAGKSSLLRSIAGLERPQEGRIMLGADTWFDAVHSVWARPEHRRVGYQPQDYGLFPHLTVAANVAFAERRERPDLLERFRIAHLAQARPDQLSGGERQRVALARALAREPDVLLLDEPLSALDEITRRQVRAELRDILDDLQLPTLLVTHEFDDATALAGRIGVLQHGRLLQLGTPEELIGMPADAVVAAHTGANVLDGVAEPAGSGSVVRLTQGGQLATAHRAQGAVTIAIHPWQLKLCEPRASDLVDPVIGVHRDRGTVAIRTARFIVHADPDDPAAAAVREGDPVGLRAAPERVLVVAAEPLDGFVMLGS